MTPIRPLEEQDLPKLAGLHHRVFQTKVSPHDPIYAEYLRDVFLEPAGETGLHSLVYVDEGEIAGFLGVVRRRMTFDASPVSAAVSSQFVVEPGARSGFVALQLLRHFLDGPQDLSITDEASDVSRHLWTKLGGATSFLHSVHWMLPLRPARLAVSLLERRRFGGWARLLTPLAGAADAVASRLKPHARGDGLRSEHLDLTALPELASSFSPGLLRPEYDAADLRRILLWAERRQPGRLYKSLLRTEEGRPAGWYVFAREANGSAEVLQVGAAETHLSDVLDRLALEAACSGCLCLTGRLEPALVHEISRRLCVIHPRRQWMLVHSRRPELQGALERGDAFLSRLDGEWAIRFT